MESPSTTSAGDVTAARHLRARLRFRHLELLVALGESRSLHKASGLLAMTQPAASKLLREIELMIGVRLFERSRAGVAPTAAAGALIHQARRLLGLLDGVREEIIAIERGAKGKVRMGVAAVAAPVLLPRIRTRLAADEPDVVLSIKEGGPEMLEELRSAKLDCVIGRIFEGDEGTELVVEDLYDEPVVVVVRPGHPLARARKPVRWDRALQFDWILPPEGAPLRRALQAWFARSDLRMPAGRFESLSVLANVAIVRDSDMLALLPSRVAAHYAAQGLLHVLPIPWPVALPGLPGVALIRRRGEAPSPAVAALIAAVHGAVLDARRPARALPRSPAPR